MRCVRNWNLTVYFTVVLLTVLVAFRSFCFIKFIHIHVFGHIKLTSPPTPGSDSSPHYTTPGRGNPDKSLPWQQAGVEASAWLTLSHVSWRCCRWNTAVDRHTCLDALRQSLVKRTDDDLICTIFVYLAAAWIQYSRDRHWMHVFYLGLVTSLLKRTLNAQKWFFNIHCVPNKTATVLFFNNNSVNRGPISMIFGIRSPEETLHRTQCMYVLIMDVCMYWFSTATSLLNCLEIQKSYQKQQLTLL